MGVIKLPLQHKYEGNDILRTPYSHPLSFLVRSQHLRHLYSTHWLLTRFSILGEAECEYAIHFASFQCYRYDISEMLQFQVDLNFDYILLSFITWRNLF